MESSPAAAGPSDTRRGLFLGPRPGRLELAVLLLIVAAGAAARFVRLGHLPLGAAGSEEGTSWLVTAGQLAHGYPLLPSGITYWKGWPYTAFAALASLPFGLSAWSLRVPSAVAGVLGIPIGWATARGILARLKVEGWPAAAGALLCAYLLALSQWGILMSRWGRFYAMGQTLFLAGVGIAAIGLTASGRPSRAFAWLFGGIVLIAAATFHPGALLLLALPVAWGMGIRLGPADRRVIAAFLAACALWFVGVLFLWKAGHVSASSGWKDLSLMVGLPFWKHMTLLLAVSVPAWLLLSRAAPMSLTRKAAVMMGLLGLLELLIAVAVGKNKVDTGALRGFATLVQGHPGLMALVFLASLALLVRALRLSVEGRTAAAILWFLTVVPIALVGASTGNFVPRYLLFTFGPLAVMAAVGFGIVLTWVPRGAPRALAGAALALVCVWAVGPAVGAAGAARMARTDIGESWPPLLACSPTRAYALDLETPSRFVASRMAKGDLVVSTARSIPEAIIGHMDYFFRIPDASNAAMDESGGPFNILTGCPVLSRPDQVIDLCASSRVFVIIDERALHLAEVRDLKARLLHSLGGPAYTDGKYAEVYVLPSGCRIESSESSASSASQPGAPAPDAPARAGATRDDT